MDRIHPAKTRKQHHPDSNHRTPEGRGKRGRPKNTWRPTTEGELKTLKHTWGTIQRLDPNTEEWRLFVAALHASRHNEQ